MASEDYKEKYEILEKKFNKIVELSKQVTSDYDNLKEQYEKIESQNQELLIQLSETKNTLSELQNAIEPAIKDFDNLNTELEIQKQCRTEAEIYASKIVKNNNKLKRESQMLLQHVQPNFKIPFDSVLISDADEEEDKLHNDYRELKNKYDQSQLEIVEIKNKLLEREYELSELKTAIEPAIVEFQELSNQLEIEHQCKTKAEKYAREMVQDNRKLKTQSIMLLQHLPSDFNITSLNLIDENSSENTSINTTEYEKKISELEGQLKDLNKALTEGRNKENELNIKVKNLTTENKNLNESLEEHKKSAANELTKLKDKNQKELTNNNTLELLADKNATDENKSLAESLKFKLASSTAEIDQLQTRLRDLEKWKADTELEMADLKLNLENALRPPPPPPMPPPPIPIFKRKEIITSPKINGASPMNAETNNKLMEELKKTMSRIKNRNPTTDDKVKIKDSEEKSEIPRSLQYLHNLSRSSRLIDTAKLKQTGNLPQPQTTPWGTTKKRTPPQLTLNKSPFMRPGVTSPSDAPIHPDTPASESCQTPNLSSRKASCDSSMTISERKAILGLAQQNDVRSPPPVSSKPSTKKLSTSKSFQ